MKRTAYFLLATALLSATGCAQFDMRKNIPWGETLLGEQEKPPGKLICMWTDTVMRQGDLPARRGFGGRLMFMGTDGKPVKVAGELVVYAYNEVGRDPNSNVPDCKFVFTQDQFDKHYSKSPAGHSYSFWLPWDAAGSAQADVSLIARFTPVEGGTVVSEPSRVLLPGTALPPGAAQAMAGGGARKLGVAQAGAPSAAGGQQASEPALEGTLPHGEGASAENWPVRQTNYQAGTNLRSPQVSPRLASTTIALPQQLGGRMPVSVSRNLPQLTYGDQASADEHEAAQSRGGMFTAARMGRPAGAASGLAPRARFGLERSRALGAPLAGLSREHVPSPRFPAESPSPLPPTPESGLSTQSAASATGYR